MGLTCSVVVLLGGSRVLGSCVVGWVSRARQLCCRVSLMCSVVVLSSGSHVLGSCVVG